MWCKIVQNKEMLLYILHYIRHNITLSSNMSAVI